MFDVSLFFGLPLNSIHINHLASLNSKIKELFIHQQDSSYLLEIEHNGQRYLGKKIEKSCDLSELLLIEKNIYSLLSKILPTDSYQQEPLILFAYQNP